MFLDRFVSLPREELSKINFIKHIMPNADEGKLSLGLSNSRTGSAEDAMEILSVVLTYHRDADGMDDPIDISYFLGDNKACRDKFSSWLQKTANEEVSRSQFSS